MRRLAQTLMLVLAAQPVLAAKRVELSNLEQQLRAESAKPDAEAAYHIGDLELSERLSWTRFTELERLLPGDKSRQALRAIADESQFQPAPASEIPAKATPDLAEQKRIVGLVVGYLRNAIPQLPNFQATRLTEQFEDTPLIQMPEGGFVPYEPLHHLSANTVSVTYQDGRETVQAEMRADNRKATEGLTTWGVFGPILGMVFVDAAQSKLSWGHWEQDAGGALAVFQYEVPAGKSHYELNYCCVVGQPGVTTGGIEMSPLAGHIQVGGATTATAVNLRAFRKLVGYHGEIAVDPGTGAIRRLSLIADIKQGEPVVKANILVEYGAVQIGGKTYICPIRSVSASLAQSVQVNQHYNIPLANQIQPLKNAVSDEEFRDYHVFRAEMRVLTTAEATQEQNELPGQPGKVGSGSTATAAAANVGEAAPTTPPANAPAEVASIASAAPAQPAVTPAPAPAAEVNAEPEISVTAATNPADVPGALISPQTNTGITLRTTTRLVEVAVAAVDKKGRPITDLKPGDLEIYDNGRKQAVKDFAQAGAGVQMAAPAPQAVAPTGEPVTTNRPVAAQQDTENTTVLLIDAAHVDFSDVTYARGEILRFLKAVPADERVGLYILGSHGFQVVDEPTMDHAGLAATLAKWMPSAQDLAHAQAEEQRNRQQFDWVHQVTDLAYVNGNGEGGSDPSMYASGSGAAAALIYPSDAELRPLGDRPEDFALHLLVGVGRHLAAVAGHKTLVWIASDNVLADFSPAAVGREDTGNRFLDQASLQARETLNEAHVSIYPLDVSQLESGTVTADIGNRNVVAMGKTEKDGSSGPGLSLKDIGDQAAIGVNGRDTARLHEDTKPIQGAFRDLATATGGRALRRAGDIAAELNSIVADGRAAYLLSFTPDTQADGKYHTLTVKCLRKDVTLRYRNGYLYSEEPATMKDRFREAVWQPRDENEIGLTAATATGAKGPAIRLHIAATDLELAQQDGRWTDKVDVFVVVRDDSGLHAAVRGKRLGLALTPATYQRDLKDGLTVEESLPKLPDGALVRLIVIDENSRRMGSVTIGANGEGQMAN